MEATLPPIIATSDPGSFARRTIVERKPKIIAQVLEVNRLAPAEKAALQALDREMRTGTVTSPLDGPGVPRGALAVEERAAWARGIGRYTGRSWLDIPWYFAEAFFYLKLLAACGYFTRAGADPFAPLKERELRGPRGGLESAALLCESRAGIPADEAILAALMSCLWGNRVDLSNFEIDEENRRTLFQRERELLVVDHAEAAVAALGAARRVHIILDNAGPELVSDLLLSAREAGAGRGRRPARQEDALLRVRCHRSRRCGDHCRARRSPFARGRRGRGVPCGTSPGRAAAGGEPLVLELAAVFPRDARWPVYRARGRGPRPCQG